MKMLIMKLLIDAGYSVRAAEMFAAVSAHETAMWSSELFLRANNLFGMKIPTERLSLRAGSYTIGKEVYSAYATIEDSIKDFILYLKARMYANDFKTIQELTLFMQSKGYYTDSFANYSAAVKRRLEQLGGTVTDIPGVQKASAEGRVGPVPGQPKEEHWWDFLTGTISRTNKNY